MFCERRPSGHFASSALFWCLAAPASVSGMINGENDAMIAEQGRQVGPNVSPIPGAEL